MDSIKSAAILRDFLNFRSWRHQKRSNSARLPQFPKLATSDTKQFRETSFKNGKLSAELTPLRVFQLRLPRKSYARSYEVLHLSRKIILTNLKIWCSKMQSLSGNQRADLLRSLMKMSFVLRLPREMHLCRSSSNVPGLKLLQTLTFCWFFTRCKIPCTCHAKTTSEQPKVVRTLSFSHLDLEMCFAPQQRALFRHLNFQKCSEAEVFFAFELRNVLPATTAYTFWISTFKSALNVVCFVHFDLKMCFAPKRREIFQHLNFQKFSKPVSFLSLLTSKCPSRHNGIHFLDIWTSKSARYPVCFVHCASRHNDVDFLNVLTAKSALNVVCFAHFDLEMCFAPQRLSLSWHLNFEKCSEPGVFCTLCFTPQRRRLFRHLNFQKCSEAEVFCAFWLRNVLCATTA